MASEPGPSSSTPAALDDVSPTAAQAAAAAETRALLRPAAAAAHPPAAFSAGVAPRLVASPSLASIISVVPSEAHTSYRRHILVAIDNSSNSKHALEFAVRHMYVPGDKLHLVHVVPEPATLHPWPGMFVPPDDALEREEFKEAAAMIHTAFAPLVTRAAIPSDAHLIVAPQAPGSIASILLDKQEDLDAAALVVGPHAKGGLQEWWLGSVTKALLRHSPVPVVVVPPCV